MENWWIIEIWLRLASDMGPKLCTTWRHVETGCVQVGNVAPSPGLASRYRDAPCSTSLVSTTIGEYSWDRPQQDLEVQTHGPVADVMQVESDHIMERHLAAAADLPQASETRHSAQPPQLPILVLFNFRRERRAWTHKAHFAAEHIDQLW